MILGIMGAMPDEVDQLCAKLENVTVEPYGGVEYHKGTLAGKQVVVCCAGMGKANAAATTQVLITKFGAEKIIFSGIAGNMTSKIGIGDVVIGKTVLYHDAQLDMICQNPPFLKEYSGDPALIAAAVNFGEGKNNYTDRLNVRGNIDLQLADWASGWVLFC